MTRKLIKKQLGNVLLKYLLVPRISTPKLVHKINIGDLANPNSNTVKYLKEAGLHIDLMNPSNSIRNNTKTGYFINEHNTAIYQRGHIMYYRNTKANRENHRVGIVRMKRISSLDEFNDWYANNSRVDIIKQLKSDNNIIHEHLDKDPQPSNKKPNSIDNNNHDNDNIDNNNDVISNHDKF